MRYLLALVLALFLVAAACGDDDEVTPTPAPPVTEPPVTEPPVTEPPVEEFPPTAGALGGVLVDVDEAVQIRTLQAISGAVEFLGTDQVRGVELALEDFGDVLGHAVD
ncbi:MAG: hypothetical protein ACE5KX_07945, partial [Acidimicrobiia bacterium]